MRLTVFGLWLFALAFGGCTTLSGAEDLHTRGDVSGSGSISNSNSTTQSPTLPDDSNSKVEEKESSKSSTPSSMPSKDDEPFVPKASVPKSPLDCDGNTCGTGGHCCQTGDARGQCVGANEACGGSRITCAPSECGTGEVCCAFTKHKLAACVKASECTNPADTMILCNEHSDCSDGMTCTGGSDALHSGFCKH